ATIINRVTNNPVGPRPFMPAPIRIRSSRKGGPQIEDTCTNISDAASYCPPYPRSKMVRCQKLNFAPSCRTRGSYVVVTCPKFLSVVPVSTPRNSVWLKALKDSNRSSNFTRSVMGMVLNSDRLKLKRPGPTTASFLALPKPWLVPPFQGATGAAKELVLNQASTVCG